jgi:peptidoglycan/xylan/chitin deacetylase (PgdA/CDA1 family)
LRLVASRFPNGYNSPEAMTAGTDMNSTKRLASLTITVVSLIAVCCLWPVHGLAPLERWREYRSGFVVDHVDISDNVIALTFDDGPDPRYTPLILDILKQQKIRATFFPIGKRMSDSPEIARRIVQEGHEIGNHTESHSEFESLRESDSRAEIDRCAERIRSVTGRRPTMFRPPRGLWTAGQYSYLRERGYSVVLWSLAFDRKSERNSEKLRNRVVSLAKPGDIILFHDGSASKYDERGSTIRELNNVILGLEERGFRFVTVPELVNLGSTGVPKTARNQP